MCKTDWGPMWAWSCFSFESFNGEIKETVHGTGNVCLQIFWALMAQKHIEQAALNVVSDNVANFIRKQTKSLGVQMAEEKIKEPCGVKKTFAMSKRFKFRKEVKDQLHTFVNSSDTSMFVKAKKMKFIFVCTAF